MLGYDRNVRELHTDEDGKELQSRGRRPVIFPGLESCWEYRAVDHWDEPWTKEDFEWLEGS